ncbi:MAG: TQO small subunit DoxD [Anaerolineales bacterium]
MNPKLENTLQNIGLLIARLALGYLFFTQLWWKLPPTFGCPADFALTTGTPQRLQRTGGLCDWIGIETVWSQAPSRPVLATVGGPNWSVDISPMARLNGAFLEGFVQPNIRWFGWVVFGMEAFIFVSLFFGLFSRLGALVSIAQSLQLMIGLAGITNPPEWEWGYNLMVVLSIVLAAIPAGRWLGVDQWLRPKLMAAADGGNALAKILVWLT